MNEQYAAAVAAGTRPYWWECKAVSTQRIGLQAHVAGLTYSPLAIAFTVDKDRGYFATRVTDRRPHNGRDGKGRNRRFSLVVKDAEHNTLVDVTGTSQTQCDTMANKIFAAKGLGVFVRRPKGMNAATEAFLAAHPEHS